jgi:acyl-CoA carboxylase subunit beta
VPGAAQTGLASAQERAALVIDAGSLREWDADVVSDDPLGFSDTRPYRERLAQARERTGLGEAVLTGAATVAGRRVAIVAGEFGFLGGSVGVATGERIARAFERAQRERVPLVALPASGGSRMQEGTLALVGMAKLAAAAGRFRAAGLPYVVCLTDPTTGGAFASWASLGTVTFALPGALLGFAGPRVVELLHGAPLPEGTQRAETLLAHGLLDDVVEPGELRERVARVLAVAAPEPGRAAAAPGGRPAPPGDAATAAAGPAAAAPGGRPAPPGDAATAAAGPAAAAPGGRPTPPAGPAPAAAPAPAGPRDAWTSLQHARDRRRPGAADLLAVLATDVTELRGDRAGHPDDPACLAALARVGGTPAVVVAQRRSPDGAPGAMNAAGFRKARRAMALAAELRLPLITIVDTPGAELSPAAEHGGLAGEIAGCLADIAPLPVPTLALLLGEGGSGGALALLAADRVVCAEHASLGVIAPEGASAILHRDTDHAAELAATQGGASWELLAHGIADALVPEPVPAHEQPNEFIARAGAALAAQLATLTAQAPAERLATRQARWRTAGGESTPLPPSEVREDAGGDHL